MHNIPTTLKCSQGQTNPGSTIYNGNQEHNIQWKSTAQYTMEIMVREYFWICVLDYSKANSKVRFRDLSGLSPLVKIDDALVDQLLLKD